MLVFNSLQIIRAWGQATQAIINILQAAVTLIPSLVNYAFWILSNGNLIQMTVYSKDSSQHYLYRGGIYAGGGGWIVQVCRESETSIWLEPEITLG